MKVWQLNSFSSLVKITSFSLFRGSYLSFFHSLETKSW